MAKKQQHPLKSIVGQTIEYTGEAWSYYSKQTIRLNKQLVTIEELSQDNYGSGYVAYLEGPGHDPGNDDSWIVLDPGLWYDIIYVVDEPLPIVEGVKIGLADDFLEASLHLDDILMRIKS